MSLRVFESIIFITYKINTIMRKFSLLAFIAIASSFWTSKTLAAQDIINLGTNDNIATTLTAHVSSTDLVLVIPSGYTNPQGTTAITLPASLAAGTKITFRGDGTMPNLIIPSFSFTSGLSLAAFKFQNLTLTGKTTNSTYLLNVANGTAINIDTLSFTGCNINSFLSLARFNSSNGTTKDQKANYVLIDNCKLNNSSSYSVIYTGSVGVSIGPVVVKKSTFYGFAQTIFMCQNNTESVSISDCTFDNIAVIPGTTARYIVDLGTTQASPIILANCVFGYSPSASTYSNICKTGGSITINNCYKTSDCTATANSLYSKAGIIGSITNYAGISAQLFKNPNRSIPGASFVTTADYSINDRTFPGINNVGDPRWYSSNSKK